MCRHFTTQYTQDPACMMFEGRLNSDFLFYQSCLIRCLYLNFWPVSPYSIMLTELQGNCCLCSLILLPFFTDILICIQLSGWYNCLCLTDSFNRLGTALVLTVWHYSWTWLCLPFVVCCTLYFCWLVALDIVCIMCSNSFIADNDVSFLLCGVGLLNVYLFSS